MDVKTEIQQDDYFSWGNIEEITGINQHLTFCGQIIDKYLWKPQVKKKFLQQLKKIELKQEDQKLNLSVIGEFATGKSTFINALLRQDLLVTSSLQGTTVTSTIIEYGEEYSYSLEYRDGHAEAHPCDTLGQLKEQVDKVTTDSDLAQRINCVRVWLPADVLADNIRIIDTPGTNAIERWHEEITIHTLEDVSDVSLVLMDGNKGMPETYRVFVENNLSGILPRCVFVVTKLDQVREKERGRMLDYIQNRLCQNYDLTNPMVLPYYSLEVLHTFHPDDTKTQNQEFLRQTYDNEEKMLKLIAKQRAITQIQKLIALVDGMYLEIETRMQDLSGECLEKLEMLRRTQQTDLNTFISQQKEACSMHFRTVVKENEWMFPNRYEKLTDEATKIIMSRIDDSSSLDNLKDYITSKLIPGLSKDCERGTTEILGTVQEISDYVNRWYMDEINRFQIQFHQEFAKLNILDVDVSIGEELPTEVETLVPNMDAVNTFISQKLSKENWIMGGGAVAGAAIGTAIVPVLGTLLGGIIGAVVGGMAAPDTDKTKKEVKEHLSPVLKSHFNRTIHQVEDAKILLIQKASEALETEIDRYMDEYEKVVLQQIKAETQKRLLVENQLASLEKDIKSVALRKEKLYTLNAQLNQLSR